MRESQTGDRGQSEAAALSLLRKYWGHTSFRPGQWETISAAMSGSDVLAVLPTGTGKSVCYQLPAIAREGVAVVITPLIALMADQVERLLRRGLPATHISSTLPPSEQRRRWRDAATGAVKFLYVAPEQLRSPAFQAFAAGGRISFVTVDEAHCISQWGDSFRPAYRNIWKYLPRERQVLALTATATRMVRRDISGALRLRKPAQIVTGFDRPNIRWSVMCGANRKAHVGAIVRGLNGSAIMYAITRRSAETWHGWLLQHGVSASVYHGGLDEDRREESQMEWLAGRTRIMVATCAFGMGIDKADVRSVVHLGMPSSVSAYYQEAGRAGRDGLASEAVLLFRDSDLAIHRGMLKRSDPRTRARGQHHLAAMKRYVMTSGCRRRALLTHFGEVHRGDCMRCDNCAKARRRASWTHSAESHTAGTLVRMVREGELTWAATSRMDVDQRRVLRRLLDAGRVAPVADLDGRLRTAS